MFRSSCPTMCPASQGEPQQGFSGSHLCTQWVLWQHWQCAPLVAASSCGSPSLQYFKPVSPKLRSGSIPKSPWIPSRHPEGDVSLQKRFAQDRHSQLQQNLWTHFETLKPAMTSNRASTKNLALRVSTDLMTNSNQHTMVFQFRQHMHVASDMIRHLTALAATTMWRPFPAAAAGSHVNHQQVHLLLLGSLFKKQVACNPGC